MNTNAGEEVRCELNRIIYYIGLPDPKVIAGRIWHCLIHPHDTTRTPCQIVSGRTGQARDGAGGEE